MSQRFQVSEPSSAHDTPYMSRRIGTEQSVCEGEGGGPIANRSEQAGNRSFPLILSPKMSEQSEQEHQMDIAVRAGLALNNIGVSLLQRHHFNAAWQVFRDAIHIFGVICSSTGSSGLCPRHVSDKVNKAAKRLADRCQKPPPNHQATNIDFQVLNEDGDTRLSSVLPRGPKLSAKRLFAIRIEPTQSFCASECDARIDTAIVLCNMASTYRCLSDFCFEDSDSSRTSDRKAKYANTAQEIWRLAHAGLAQYAGELACGPHTTETRIKVLDVAIVGMKSLVEALVQWGEEEEAETYIASLDALETRFLDLERVACQFPLGAAEA